MKTFGRIWTPVFGSLSDHGEDELMDHIFNASYSPITPLYVGMGTAGADTGLTAEPSGDNYAREVIAFNVASARKVVQNGLITFNQASGDWGTMASYGVFDAISGGNMLGWGDFNVSKPVVNGNTPSIADAQIEISITAGEITDFLVHELLDHMFGNLSYSAPDTFILLADTALADGDTDPTAKECAGTDYARKQVEPNGGSAPTWKNSASGLVENLAVITFATPGSGGWDQVTAIGIADAISGGNLLMYDNSPGGDGQTPAEGDTVQFAADALDITMT
jgi:hypothetical protein